MSSGSGRESKLHLRYSALHELDSPANRLIRDAIWGREGDIGQQSFITPRYLDELIHRLAIDESVHALDVGSGVGGPAIYIASATGCQVSGIEINRVGVEVARDLARDAGLEDTVDFYLGDAMKMPFDNETFGLALSLNVMNVFEDKVGLFREVRRVLRSGARWALLTGTFELDVDDVDVRRKLSRNGNVPLYDDSLAGYKRKLVDAGFAIEEVTEYIADFQVQIRRWRDAYQAHADAIEKEQGTAAMREHLAYFDTYLAQVEAGKASNHLLIARRP